MIIVIAIAITLQLTLPDDLQLHPTFILPGLEMALSLAILITNPGRISRPSRFLRTAGLSLTALISLANAWSAAEVDPRTPERNERQRRDQPARPGRRDLRDEHHRLRPLVLGVRSRRTAARARALREHPDFLFPQQTSPELAPSHWAPHFIDYLWLSYTNATAFSPTDIMPLSRWAKQLMFLQSAISLVTVALVIARAVNIFK